MNVVFISGNDNKAKQLAQWLGRPTAHQKVNLDEIQSLNSQEIVDHKAQQAYQIVQQPVLVEDVSLVFEALGQLPGPFIKWFEASLGNEGLCRLAAKLDNQHATATITYGLYDGTHMHYFASEMHGTVPATPRGADGFGFDSIFVNDGQQLTRAEMDEATYEETSYRAVAIAKLRAFLEDGEKD